MKPVKYFPKEFGIAFAFLLFIIFAQLLGFGVGIRIAKGFYAFFIKLVILVPCIFVLIGLLDVWIPKHWIQNHVGEDSGVKGIIYIMLLAIFQGGPLYGAFPTAHLLWKKGCSMRNVFMYLGAFSTLKAPMILFEFSFLGWKFALVRSVVALPVFVLIAEIMARNARQHGLQMNEV